MNQIAYAAPEKLSEVVALLAENPGSHILAGGQNLLVEPSRRHLSGSLLVDLRKVAGLVGIEAKDGALRIGSMTTIGAIAASELIHKTCPILAAAAGLVGDAQVRNRATIGGAIVEADPGSDLIPVLMVVDAVLEIAAPKLRQVAVNDFFAGPEPNLSASEVISAITIPRTTPRTGAIYEKMKHWATLYALCGVAAEVTLASDGSIAKCRIAVTGSTERPLRLKEVEAALIGHPLSDEALGKATSLIDGRFAYRGDPYASGEYRAHLTRVLTGRAVRRAAAMAALQI
jgi:aerobic carbon-monoxide dehydrogenase medium subunit